MTRGDRVILAAILVSVLLSAPVALAMASGRSGEEVAVIVGPLGRTTVPLDSHGRYEVSGRVGTVTFEVNDEGMFCVESSCPDHVCVHQHEVLPGRPVVCAPNGVVASIDSAPDGGDLDAVSR